MSLLTSLANTVTDGALIASEETVANTLSVEHISKFI